MLVRSDGDSMKALKRTIVSVLPLVLLTVLFVTGCRTTTAHSEPASWPSETHDGMITAGGAEMKREVCTIKSIQEDTFTVENTKKEIYTISREYLGGFKEEDMVLLLYLNRSLLEDGAYSAEVYAIYPCGGPVVKPAK